MIKILVDVKEIADLGKAVIDLYKIEIPDEIKKYVNYSELGKDFHKQKDGIFHNNEYIYNETNE